MNTTTIISEEDYQDLVKLKLNQFQIHQLELFLEPFYEVGRYYVLRVVKRAVLAGKLFDEIMHQLCTMWLERWKNGTPDRIGDPEDTAPPGIGAANTGGFVLVNTRLGLAPVTTL